MNRKKSQKVTKSRIRVNPDKILLIALFACLFVSWFSHVASAKIVFAVIGGCSAVGLISLFFAEK